MLSLIMGGFTVMTLDDTPTNAVVGVLWLTMTAVMLGSGVGVLCAKSRTAGRICWTLHGVGAAFNLIVFVVAAASLSASTDCNKHACMAHLILQVARAVMAITCLPCLQVRLVARVLPPAPALTHARPACAGRHLPHRIPRHQQPVLGRAPARGRRASGAAGQCGQVRVGHEAARVGL